MISNYKNTQKGGERLLESFRAACFKIQEQSRYNFSTAADVRLADGTLTIMKNDTYNRVLQIQVGIRKNGENYNNYNEGYGASSYYPYPLKWKYIYDDNDTVVYAGGASTVSEGFFSKNTVENGENVLWTYYVTITEFPLGSTTGKMLLFSEPSTSLALQYVVKNVFLVTENINYISNAPFSYLGENTPDIISFIEDALSKTRSIENSVLIPKPANINSLVFLPGHVLNYKGGYDDIALLKFSSKASSCKIFVGSNNLAVVTSGSSERFMNGYSDVVSPIYSDSGNHFYEVGVMPLLQDSLQGVEDLITIGFYNSTATSQIQVDRVVVTHNSNYNKQSFVTSLVDSINWDSGLDSDMPITNKMINDLLYTANRKHYSYDYQEFSATYSDNDVWTRVRKKTNLFKLFDGNNVDFSVIDLTDWKIAIVPTIS